mmetsp:Transcript_36827/g.78166  ORF Transcript_36827/g.78166 Transcript_36827/m.78166 type:complete len:97 (-) Transcript_36827:60-350(-)
MGATPQRFLATTLVLLLLQIGLAAAAPGSNKGFFDGLDWNDPSAAALELGWRLLKIFLALSPLVCIAALFCCAKDDPEEEALRRKKKYDFSLAGEE